MRWTLAATAALTFAAGAARPQPAPDPIARAERSVVRVVAVSIDATGAVTGVSLGSGFAVAPGEVVTNHHVIAGGASNAVQVFVIPERDSGGRPAQAQVRGDWPVPDLALLDAPGLAAPSLAVTLAIPAKDAPVYALGYPGITDAMRKLPVEAMLSPAEPYVTSGSVALVSATAPGGTNVQTIFHTAPINEGNSGGPLVDPCGRVIGVNAQIGGFEDAQGAFQSAAGQSAAVSAAALTAALGAGGVKAIQAPCVAPMEAAISARLAADETAIAQDARARRGFARALEIEAARERRDFAATLGAAVALMLVAIAVAVALRRRRPAR